MAFYNLRETKILKLLKIILIRKKQSILLNNNKNTTKDNANKKQNKNICTMDRNHLRLAWEPYKITKSHYNLWSQTFVVSLVANGNVKCFNDMELWTTKETRKKLK